MKPLIRIVVALLLASVAAGCAVPGAIPLNTINADELLKRMGKPTESVANPAGGEYWDYVYGPAGFETWRFGIDGGRIVRSSEQLITYNRLHQVQAGVSTEKDVRMLLGKPSAIMRLQNETTWEWRVNLHPSSGHYVVRFDPAGVALGTMVLTDFTADSDFPGF